MKVLHLEKENKKKDEELQYINNLKKRLKLRKGQ